MTTLRPSAFPQQAQLSADESRRVDHYVMEQAQAIGHVGSWNAGFDPAAPVAWSAECARILGRDHGAPPELRALLAMVHPDDRAAATAAGHRVLAGAARVDLEHRVVRPDGGVRWVFSRVLFERDGGGLPSHCIGMVQDVTDRRAADEARRASDERYRRIVETTAEGVITLDVDGVVTFANARMAAMLGYTRDELVGAPLDAFLPADQRGALHGAFPRRRAEGGAERHEQRFARKDGSDLWTVISSNALVDGAGRFEGTLGLVTDVVTHSRALETLRHSEQQLRAAQKMEAIGGLAGGIAHDFNNMLSVILSYTSLALEDRHLNDRLRQDLAEVEKAAQRARGLTRQLLLFSRQQILDPQVLDLNESVRGVERLLGRLLGAHIEVSLRLMPGDASVFADAGQIDQVIMNLAVNAHDAMLDGGELTLATGEAAFDAAEAAERGLPAPGRYVWFSMRDTGVGMDAATRAQLFAPPAAAPGRGRRVGLGLSTVLEIVKKCGGGVEVDSAPKVGTTVRVFLPRHDEAAAPVADVAAAPRSLQGFETVLLVEDDAYVRASMRLILRRQGYKVIEAHDAEEALRLCAEDGGRIDLLVTDVVMPRISGPQLAAKLAAGRPAMKVLYVSGYTDDAVVRRGVSESRAAFLAKPLTPETLSRKVREVLGSDQRGRAE